MLLLLPYIWLVLLCVLNMAYSLHTIRAVSRLDVQEQIECKQMWCEGVNQYLDPPTQLATCCTLLSRHEEGSQSSDGNEDIVRVKDTHLLKVV